MKNKKFKSLKKLNSILDLLRWTSTQFNSAKIHYGHGTDNFWDEALHLVLPSLHLPIESPKNIYQAQLTQKEKKHVINQVLLRVKHRIPVPYLTHQAWFCNTSFYVDKNVFIPRSPIGELIKSKFCNLLPKTPHHILDMCTGSGCIAIATAMQFPKAQIDATDISQEALKIAEYNIKLYALENRIVPIYSDLFYNLPQIKYDLILSNPPYINENDICYLPKEFHAEPKLSLCAGTNELNIVKKILYNANNFLTPEGILICEVGETKKQLKKTYPNIPFHWIHFNNGGDGVFALTYNQLINNKILFES